ncbi:Mannose-6-phosphate isomerase, cupin superfamily [Candidatus Methanophagaceae archaeon]|nr:Mannose-6-phosphate isomerase, cupin superfamily [Methanophagales archaeon]KAF5434703.1 Mannose-6-phosphate isomerase, cupin superfamily [Methanophagales archaeon]
MATKIFKPSVIEVAGTKPKIIEEFVGKVNTGNSDISIAKMKSSGGWAEPGQKPEFDEYTVVLKGMLRIETESETLDINEGEAVRVKAGEWVRYSSPGDEGAEYIAVCLPAFSPEIVHRDE